MFELTTLDIFLFVAGIVTGTLVGYYIGSAIFNTFFKAEAKLVTLEATAKFQGIQQVVNYVLGFALATMAMQSSVFLIMLVLWMGFQTWLASKVFHFKNPVHGFTFACLDTVTDFGIGALFGKGASTFNLSFNLVKMALFP
jgi:hypothetical protein